MPSASAYESEIVTVSGVDENGLIAPISYAVWREVQPRPPIPPNYDASTAEVFKWGSPTAGTGATVSYWYNTAYDWTADQEAAFEAAMALWQAVANINLVRVDTQAAADFQIQSVVTGKPGYWQNAGFDAPAVGSDQLGQLPQSTINGIYIDPVYSPVTTDLAAGYGYGMQTLVHELGHMLGLGHGGPYDGEVDAMVQQFGPYDTRLWTIMSYIDPSQPALYKAEYPVTGTEWNGYYPLTPMMLDILAAQRLYGVATDGPLTGGNHVFGFNSNIQGPIGLFYDFTRNLLPVVTIWENGTHNTLDLSGYTTDSLISLIPGTFSSVNGMKNNIGIAFGTVIETGIGGSGRDAIYASDADSFLYGNAGTDILQGGAGDDVLSGGAAPDLIDGGGGLNVLRDTLSDFNGDNVSHFGLSTTIDVSGALIGRDHLVVTANADGTTTLGLGDTQILLQGHYGGGDFMAAARSDGVGPHTDVTFERFLPQLEEGLAVSPDAINGIANQPFMTGDSVVGFTVTLREAVSAFGNALGWYKVAPDGTIVGVDILFGNTRAAGGAGIDLGTPASGEQIGFFLVQDGFSRFGDLPDNLSFLTQGSLTPGNANAGLPLALHSATLGILDVTVFHSIQALNPGDALQVLSGTAPGGRDLQIGFEDLLTATGDNDFQDVVINLHTSRDDVFFV